MPADPPHDDPPAEPRFAPAKRDPDATRREEIVPAAEPRIAPAERERDASRRVAEVAARQHGVVAVWQLREAGVRRSATSRWLQSGRLIRLYPGVYAVGHAALTVNGLRMAAVLAAGPEADLSHRSAGSVHGMFADHGTRVHVTTPRAGARGLKGFVAHQRRLHPLDRTSVDGIPVTTFERTCIDIAATERSHRLAKALERAEELGLLHLPKLHAALERNQGQRGVGRVRVAIALYEPKDPRKIRSRLESGMLRLIKTHRLPQPQVNLVLHGWEVDLHWDDRNVAIELDGWQGHRTRAAFERDHRRDLDLEARGYRVLRVSWEQFRTDRPAVLAALQRVLAV